MANPQIKRILVALKPRNEGLPLAARHARVLAQAFGAEIALMSAVHESRVGRRTRVVHGAHVVQRPAGGRSDPQATQDELIESEMKRLEERSRALSDRPPARNAQTGSPHDELLERERMRLEELARSLRDGGAKVSTRVRWQAPAHQAILEEAEDWGADLVVVGAHRSRRAPHSVLVDTDWQLMRLCPCPLLVVKDPDFESYQSILAAVDPLHRHAEPEGLDQAVLRISQQFARALGSELRAVHAFPDPDDYVYVRAVEPEPGEWYGAENMEQLHRRALTELVSYYGITAVQLDLHPGDPVDVIARVVEERGIKLMVLGAVKRGRMKALLGSTAEAVAAEVPCDVLMVKTPAQP